MPWMTRLVTFWSLLSFFMTDVPVRAATLYWDGVNNALWSLNTNWSTANNATTPDPGAAVTSLDDALFNISTANLNEAVFLNGDQAARSLTFLNTGTTSFFGGVSGTPANNTLTIGTGGVIATLGAGTITFDPTVTLALSGKTPFSTVFGTTVNVQGTLSGAGSLGKLGNGVLRLTGTNPSFTGSTTVNAGALVVTGTSQLGAVSNPVSVNGIGASTGFTGGVLILDGGTSGLTVQNQMTIAGQGPGLANNGNTGAGLFSVGNNTFSGLLTLGGPAGATSVGAAYGNTTFTGPVQLGLSNVVNFTGNGNVILAGTVSSFEVQTNRLNKGSSTYLPSTLWLQNINNNFYSNVKMVGGNIRVSDGRALGLNTSTSAIEFNSSATLELRADPATLASSASNFAGKSVVGSNGSTYTIFVDRAIGGSGLNQTVVMGTFGYGSTGRGVTVSGREG
jgi:autotransporter-associated beta strand protein